MKIKETNKTSHISWSPSKIYPAYLACGTAAQQLDASFSTTSSLELHRLNLSNLELDFNATASITTESRFNKLLWSNYLNSIIIGGCENGSIYLYDYESIINENNKEKCLIQKLSKHTGVVAALDSNPFQNNLLASGAGSSEIFIWDLNNPTTPMTPGAKVPPLDDIQCISWNRQVQHILASTCSGKCAVWDLRKNESIIKVSDNTSKLKAKIVGWHPDYATQMCLSSEDDHTPYMQMWDLRYATSPVKVLSGHTRGILSFSWCNEDSNLLISCGKDNQILCWNPNTSPNGEVLLEIPSNQWCFDLAWCSRYPQLIATASFEALVSVYSLMGGKYDVKPETTNLILDSFGVPASAPSQQPPPTQTQIIPQLKTAPKWMKRPCGVSFAFGGKLVTFGLEQQVVPQDQQQQPVAPTKFQAQKINIVQVVTDNDLVQRSQQFESTLQSGQLLEYCNYKIENAKNKFDEEIWKFILASFDASKKSKFIDLLGFNQSTLTEKIQNLINENENRSPSKDNSTTQLANKLSSKLNLDVPSSDSRPQSPSLNLAFNNQTDNLLSEALLLGRYELAIDLCMSEARYTDAILIASFAGKEIFARTQERYFKKHQTKFSKLLEGFLNQDWNLIIGNCNLNHWKEALAAILTYTEKENLFQLCKLLGGRLENDDKNQTNSLNACICYICSSNIDSFVNCWYKYKLQDNKPSHELSALLQGLVEKVMILRYSIHNVHNEYATNKMLNQPQQQPSGVSLTSVLIQYSKLLAEQGSFLTALNYLKDTNDQSLVLMKDRLYNALGHAIVQQYGIPRPENPFKQTQQATNKLTQQHTVHQQHQQQSLGARKSAGMYAPQPVVQPVQSSFMPPPNPISHPQNNNQWSNQPVYTPQPPPQPVAPVMQSQVQPPLNQFVPQKPTPPTPTFPTSAPAANIYSPAVAQQYQQENTQNEPKIQSYQEVRPATAWNDPPMVQQKAPKPKAHVENSIDPTKLFQPTAVPTSMPNYGQYGNTAFSQGYMANQTMPQANTTTMPPPPTNQNVLNPTATNGFHNVPPLRVNNPSPIQYPQTMQFQQQQYPQPMQLQQQQYPQPMQFQHQQYPQQPVQQQQQSITALNNQRNSAPTPVVEKPKLPIPTEHIILQTVFDELLKRCLESSNNPANKRKLDDVAKKLESLYDKLRESLLSENVVQGMHTIVKFVQSHDYQSALNLHSQLVATSNFSEISAFMPGIKVLIQSCQQLNVFYLNQ